MQHPVGFSDSDKFIIKGKYVYFNSPGNSYLNKFMSSLKLEEKFKNNDDYEVLCKSRATTFKNKVLDDASLHNPRVREIYENQPN